MTDRTESDRTPALPTSGSYILRFALIVLLPLLGGWMLIDLYMQKKALARLQDRVEALEDKLQRSPER